MLFSSYQFILVFVPVTIAGFSLAVRMTNPKLTMGWLILTSVAFCACAGAKSLAVIVTSAAGNYLCARAMLRSNSGGRHRRAVAFGVGICLNVLFLLYFKEEAWVLKLSNTVFGARFDLAQIEFPLGVSFLTFQMIGFLADIYRRQLKEVHCLDYLLFAFFFPRVVAGPIVRYSDVVPQFAKFNSRTLLDNTPLAICLFSIGLFKKAFIADGLAPFVTQSFELMPADGGPSAIFAWFGMLAFSLQIYFDFSGYTDMALGVSRLFGVVLPTNFNSPFKATSIVELWSRWHITLTLFLTEYIYAPLMIYLTQSRLSKIVLARAPNRFGHLVKAVLNSPAICATTVVSGLWHGSTWQFILWGILHGIYLTVNQIWRAARPLLWTDRKGYERIMNPVGYVLTLICSTAALVFFRADSVASALSILRGMAGFNGFFPTDWILLNRIGIDTWSILSAFISNVQLIKEYAWIVALILVVTLAPNTMEILSRFQPALNFRARTFAPLQNQVSAVVSEMQPIQLEATGAPATVSLVRSAMGAIQRFARDGLALNRLTAMFVALLCALGVLALNDGVKFIYARF